MTTRIYIEELADPAGKYRVRIGSPLGTVILAASRQPLLDACRMLKDLKIGGRLEMWDMSRPYPRMSADIDKGAGLIALEDPKGATLRFSKFIPFKRKANVYAKENVSG